MEAFGFEGAFPFPGKCAMCGTTNGTGIDLGVDYPEVMFTDDARRGAVLLCRDCVKLLAQKLDLLAPVEKVTNFVIMSDEQYDNVRKDILDDLGALNDLLIAVRPRDFDDGTVEASEEAETSGLNSASGQGSIFDSSEGPDGVSSDSSDEPTSSIFNL